MFNKYNDDNDKLDKMAREINDKNKLYRQEQNEYINQSKETLQGINRLFNSKYTPSEFGFFSAQGDFSSRLPERNDGLLERNDGLPERSSGLPTPLSDSPQSDFGDVTFSDMESLSSSYSSLPPKIKKHLKENKHLERYSDDNDNIIKHMEQCEECKKQLQKLMMQQNENILNISGQELKHMLILILIGIFIIIFIDVFFRK